MDEEEAERLAARELYNRGVVDWSHLGDRFFVGMDPGTIDPPGQVVRGANSSWGGGGGGGASGGGMGTIFVGGGSGGRGNGGSAFRQLYEQGWVMPEDFIGRELKINIKKEPIEEESREMSWTNPEARSIAQEILAEQRKEEMKAEVTAAVGTLQAMLDGAQDGSVFTFRKTNEKTGTHYWYAAIKSDGCWFTTAQNPREIPSDELFIEWLVGLEAWKSEALELTPASVIKRPMLDATSTES